MCPSFSGIWGYEENRSGGRDRSEDPCRTAAGRAPDSHRTGRESRPEPLLRHRRLRALEHPARSAATTHTSTPTPSASPSRLWSSSQCAAETAPPSTRSNKLSPPSPTSGKLNGSSANPTTFCASSPPTCPPTKSSTTTASPPSPRPTTQLHPRHEECRREPTLTSVIRPAADRGIYLRSRLSYHRKPRRLCKMRTQLATQPVLFIQGAGGMHQPEGSGRLAAYLARELGTGYRVIAPGDARC